MQIREAIIKFLALPNTEVLDKGIFYNVLKDLNAFEQMPASEHIMKAFLTKGYLKDILEGKKGWQIQSRHYLVETLGFQLDKVDFVINEINEATKNVANNTFSKENKTPIAPSNSMHSCTPIQSSKTNRKEGNNLTHHECYEYFGGNLAFFLIIPFTFSAFCIIHYREWSFSQALFFILGDYLYLFFHAVCCTQAKGKELDIVRGGYVAACCLILGIKSIFPFWFNDTISEFAATTLIMNCFLLCTVSIAGITTDKKYISTTSWKWTFFCTTILYFTICFGGIYLLYNQFQ